MGAHGALADEVVLWAIQPRAAAKPLHEEFFLPIADQHATVQVQALLQAQLVLSVEEHNGTPVNATGIASFAQSH